MTSNSENGEEFFGGKFIDFDILEPRSQDSNGAIYLFIGKSGSGKTTVMKSFAKAKSHFIPVAVAVSETEELNHSFAEIMPELFIYSRLDDNLISRIFDRQILSKSKLPNSYALFMADDCMNAKTNFNSKNQIKLFKTSRHAKLLCLISCQHYVDLKPSLRDQCAGVFLFKCDNENGLITLYNSYASLIPSFDIFKEIMSAWTNDHCCIFINLRDTTSDWRDRVFWYQSQIDTEEWSAVSKDVVAFHEERFNTSFDPLDEIVSRASTKFVANYS